MTADPVARSNRRWRRVCLLLLLLLGLCGGFVMGRMVPGGGFGGAGRPESDGGRWMSRLASDLDLSEEQKAKLHVIVQTNRSEASAFREESLGRYRELRRRFRGQIREILDDRQRERFDAMIRDADRRRHGRNGSASGSSGSSRGWKP